jgi:hypothetical protein
LRRPSGPARLSNCILTIEGLESRSLLSTLFTLTDQDSLLAIDSASLGAVQAMTPTTGLPAGESIVAVDILPTTGAVFGLGSEDHLYTINLRPVRRRRSTPRPLRQPWSARGSRSTRTL